MIAAISWTLFSSSTPFSGAVFAALRLEADHLVAGGAGRRSISRRVALPLDVNAVAELPAEILVPQRDAVVHVVEDGLHQLAGALDVLLGRGQRLLALTQLGDVAEHREDAAVADRLEVVFDDSGRPRAARSGCRPASSCAPSAASTLRSTSASPATGPIIAAPGLEQHQIARRRAGLHQLGRELRAT